MSNQNNDSNKTSLYKTIEVIFDIEDCDKLPLTRGTKRYSISIDLIDLLELTESDTHLFLKRSRK